MTGSDEWTWEFRPPAARSFDDLEGTIQRLLVAKLDDIVTDEWRDPPDYIEPRAFRTARSGSGTFVSGLPRIAIVGPS